MTVVATAPGQAPMTPDYASPEQMRGLSATTASDVYSLGVLLYELLTGRRPLQVSGLPAEQALHRLLEVTPMRPSAAVRTGSQGPHGASRPEGTELPRGVSSRRRARLARCLAGDLDTIALTALAKEPERRYPSAAALARDLDRHLGGLPVAARGDSFAYRTGRFVRRHRLLVAISAAALVGHLALTVGLAVQRAETVRQRDRATAVAHTLVEIFETADPGRARGETLTARSVLDSGRRRIDAMQDTPALQADLEITMGRVYTSLGLLVPAVELLREALTTRRELHPGDHREVAEGLELLGQALHDAGRSKEAEALLREVVTMRRRLHGFDHAEVAHALVLLATALHREGRHDEARARYQKAVEIRQRDAAPEPLARALNALGTLERDVGDYARAEDLHRQAVLRLEAESDGEAEPELAWTLANLGTALRRQGHYDAAEEAYTRAETMQRRLYQDPHPLLAYTLDQLGLLRLAQSRLDEAEAFLTEALGLRRQVFGSADARVADTLANLARVYLERGDLDRAERGFGESLELLRKVLPAGHKDLATALNHRADVLVRRGDLPAAEALYEEALAIHRRHFGDRHRSVALVLSNLARVLGSRGEHQRAIDLREESVDILRRHLGPEHPELAALLYNLGASYHRAGQHQAAAERYRESLAIAEPALGPEHALVRTLGRALEALEGPGDDC